MCVPLYTSTYRHLLAGSLLAESCFVRSSLLNKDSAVAVVHEHSYIIWFKKWERNGSTAGGGSLGSIIVVFLYGRALVTAFLAGWALCLRALGALLALSGEAHCTLAPCSFCFGRLGLGRGALGCLAALNWAPRGASSGTPFPFPFPFHLPPSTDTSPYTYTGPC
jgi:hypothetical protein